MTPEQFCYWLQGFTELTTQGSPTIEQWKSINEHLQTVFKKVTPNVLGGAASGLSNYPNQISHHYDNQTGAQC